MMSNEYKTWKELRADFANYTRAERNGIIVLAVLCLLGSLYMLYDRNFRVEEYDYTEALLELEEAFGKEEKAIVVKEVELFQFNPNTVTENEMLRLGFEKRAISTFMKYRNSGAKFRNEKDLVRVYSIDSSDIARVRDYLVFHTPKENSSRSKKSKPFKKLSPPTLFDFDPNTVSKEDLMRLGLSKKVIKTMLNFRNKATFRKPSDVAKIYGLKENQFKSLLPYIKIAAPKKQYLADERFIDSAAVKVKQKRFTEANYASDVVEKKSIDINRATEEEWQRIDGIGPTYARMINKFRSKLGGFYSIEQIGETYGLPDSTYQKIVPYVKVTEPTTRIQINLIKHDSLAKHPYLSYKQAKVVTNYRAQHGPYRGPKDVFKVRIFSREKWERIVPYLDYETAVDTFNHDMN